MKGVFSIFLILFFAAVGSSQNYQNYNLFIQNSPLNTSRIEPGFILKVRSNVHSNLYNNDEQFVKFKVYTSQTEFITVELEKKEIYKNGSINVTTSSGEFFEYSEGKFYSGIIKDQPNSFAVFSIFEDRIYGFVQDENLEFYNLTKFINGSNNEHIYFKEKNVVDFSEYGVCNLESSSTGNFKQTNEESINRSTGTIQLSVYYELDFLSYLHQDSDLIASLQFICQMHFVVHMIYNNITTASNVPDNTPPLTGGIDLRISQIKIWDTLDPYPTNPMADRASAFQEANLNFPGDLAHLLQVGGSHDSGIALINVDDNNCVPLGNTDDVLCINNADDSIGPYSISRFGNNEIDIETTVGTPPYSYGTALVAHELGHLLGGRHTFECHWYGDGVDFFAIERACGEHPGLCDPIPGGCISDQTHTFIGGTGFQPSIMSYCWPNNNVDYARPFNYQVASNILNNVCTLPATCNLFDPLLCTDTDFDGACNIDDDCPDNPNIINDDIDLDCNDGNPWTSMDQYTDCEECVGIPNEITGQESDCDNYAIDGYMDFENLQVGTFEGVIIGGELNSSLGTPDVIQHIQDGLCNQAISLYSRWQEHTTCGNYENTVNEGFPVYLKYPLNCGESLDITLDAGYFGIGTNQNSLEIHGSQTEHAGSFDGTQVFEFDELNNVIIPSSNFICWGEYGNGYLQNINPCIPLPIDLEQRNFTITNDSNSPINVLYFKINSDNTMVDNYTIERYDPINVEQNSSYTSLTYDICGRLFSFSEMDATNTLVGVHTINCDGLAVFIDNPDNPIGATTQDIITINNQLNPAHNFLVLDNILVSYSDQNNPLALEAVVDEDYCEVEFLQNRSCFYQIFKENEFEIFEEIEFDEDIQALLEVGDMFALDCSEAIANTILEIGYCGTFQIKETCPCDIRYSNEFILNESCLPEVMILVDPNPICNSSTVQLSISDLNEQPFICNDCSYQWSNNATTASIEISATELPSDYSITITNQFTGCEGSASITNLESLEFSLDISYCDPQSSCTDCTNEDHCLDFDGDEIKVCFNPIAPSGEVIYTIMNSDGVVVEFWANPYYYTSIPDTYTVTGLHSDSGCTVVTTFVISSNGGMFEINNNMTYYQCMSGEAILVELPEFPDDAIYSWVHEVEGELSTSSNFQPTIAGDYTVFVSNNGCNTDGTFTIEESIVDAQITNIDLTLCPDEGIVLETNYSGIDGFDEEWSEGPEIFSAGTYNVSVTNLNECSDTDVINIDETICDLDAPLFTCNPTNISLSAPDNECSVTEYYWYDGFSNLIGSGETIDVAENGVYYYVAEVDGCEFISASINIECTPLKFACVKLDDAISNEEINADEVIYIDAGINDKMSYWMQFMNTQLVTIAGFGSAQEIANAEIAIIGQVIIDTNISFNDCNIYFDINSGFTTQSANLFGVNKTIFSACNDTWNRIDISAGTIGYFEGNVKVLNSIQGIMYRQSAIAHVVDVKFFNNDRSLQILGGLENRGMRFNEINGMPGNQFGIYVKDASEFIYPTDNQGEILTSEPDPNRKEFSGSFVAALRVYNSNVRFELINSDLVSGTHISVSGTSNTTLSNIEINNGGWGIGYNNVFASYQILNEVIIKNCESRGLFLDGISSTIDIRSVEISEIEDENIDGGIMIQRSSGCTLKIDSESSVSNSERGVFALLSNDINILCEPNSSKFHLDGNTENFTITNCNNIVVQGVRIFSNVDAPGIDVTGGDQISLRDNIIESESGDGIKIDNNQRVFICNNTIKNGNQGLELKGSGPESKITKNTFDNNTNGLNIGITSIGETDPELREELFNKWAPGGSYATISDGLDENENIFIYNPALDAGSYLYAPESAAPDVDSWFISLATGSVSEPTESCSESDIFNPGQIPCDPCDDIIIIADSDDHDNDGYTNDVDCNDFNPNINPGAIDDSMNGIDENCDGVDGPTGPGFTDNDGDGYFTDVDCDDTNANLNPGAHEVLDNGIDDNCDGIIDDVVVYTDSDGDGFDSSIDCDDTNASIYPGAQEVIGNDIDENCNGIDDTLNPENSSDPCWSCVDDSQEFETEVDEDWNEENLNCSEIISNINNIVNNQLPSGVYPEGQYWMAEERVIRYFLTKSLDQICPSINPNYLSNYSTQIEICLSESGELLHEFMSTVSNERRIIETAAILLELSGNVSKADVKILRKERMTQLRILDSLRMIPINTFEKNVLQKNYQYSKNNILEITDKQSYIKNKFSNHVLDLLENLNPSSEIFELNKNFLMLEANINLAHKTLSKEDVIVQNIQMIQMVANSCPYQIGKIVNRARSILKFHLNDRSIYDNKALCNSDQTKERHIVITESFDFSIYPNPTNDELTIIISNKNDRIQKLVIYDIFGNIIHSLTSPARNENKITIPLDNISNGLYYCQLFSSDISSIKSFIKAN